MKERTEFAERLSSVLAERGITQLELAALVGVTRAAMSRYVSGEREPRFTTLLRIAEVLDVHVDELLGTTEPTAHSILRLVARTTLTDADKARLRKELGEDDIP